MDTVYTCFSILLHWLLYAEQSMFKTNWLGLSLSKQPFWAVKCNTQIMHSLYSGHKYSNSIYEWLLCGSEWHINPVALSRCLMLNLDDNAVTHECTECSRCDDALSVPVVVIKSNRAIDRFVVNTPSHGLLKALNNKHNYFRENSLVNVWSRPGIAFAVKIVFNVKEPQQSKNQTKWLFYFYKIKSTR